MSSILDPGLALTLRPMRYPDLFQQFRVAYENNSWTVQEISFANDKVDLRSKITKSEAHVINRLISFFSTGDTIVGCNVALTLYKHVNSPEARLYYGRQIFEESLHVDFYLTLLDEYIPDADERNLAFKAIETIPSIKQKGDFCFKWMDQMNSIDRLETFEQKQIFLMNLLAFACAVEGMFFFAAFAYVYYLRDRGLLHGLASGTNWVFRDEFAHMRFAFSIVEIIRRETPRLWDGMEDKVRAMLEEAIECEMQFARDVLSGGIMGLSENDMLEYLRYVANGHCQRLGMASMYEGARCPFEFMLKQDVMELTNFFERNPTQYMTGIGGDVMLDAEF